MLELILESTWGHGAIEFDTPGIRVATIAHIGGIAFGLVLWIWINLRRKKHAAAAGQAADLNSQAPR
ncbi:MAG: hypothetical protein QM760_05725 [Nibricoccus sp.]